jgi:hypothetical protein
MCSDLESGNMQPVRAWLLTVIDGNDAQFRIARASRSGAACTLIAI